MPSVVADVMTVNVVAVRRAAEVNDIVDVMRLRRVSALPVLDDEDRVIGVVSQADLLPRAGHRVRSGSSGPGPLSRGPASQARPMAIALTAGELMTSPAITIAADAQVTAAARLMQANRVKRLPVVDDGGRLVGILSRVDLLGAYDRPDADIGDEVIERVITAEFAFDPHEFTVVVRAGVVTITGTVEQQAVAVGLLRAIWDVAGVVDVRDRLSYRAHR